MEFNEELRSVRSLDGSDADAFNAKNSVRRSLTSVVWKNSNNNNAQITSTYNRRVESASVVWKDLFAGGVAGTAGVAIGHPFDTIKVRLQQQQQQSPQPPSPNKVSSSLPRPTPQNGGVVVIASSSSSSATYRGLYRGLGAPLATAALCNASMFCVHGAASRLWDHNYQNSSTSTTTTTTTTISKHAFCGVITGLVTSLVFCPIEYVKIRLQTKHLQQPNGGGGGVGANPSSSFQLAKEILYSRYGFLGFYRCGFLATVVRQTPSFAVYFPVYHLSKESINEFYINSGSRTRSTSNNNNNNNNNNTKSIDENDSPWWAAALAGGLAGSLSWAIVYPIDAVKSRIQSLPVDAPAEQRSFLRHVRNLSRNESLAGLVFSRGLAVTVIRAFPVNATIFFVYELVQEQLRRIH